MVNTELLYREELIQGKCNRQYEFTFQESSQKENVFMFTNELA